MIAKKEKGGWIHKGGTFAEKDENYYFEFQDKFAPGIYATYI